MALSYIGEIRLVGFNFAPRGWILCQGQLLSIAQYETLFVLIGTTYGGDGQTTFGLPDLRGRTPVHFGTSTSGASYTAGLLTGQESVTLTAAQVATHTHGLSTQPAAGTSPSPSGGFFAGASSSYYSTSSSGATAAVLLPGPVSPQPHSNLQPYLCLNYAISLEGVFPSRN
ncbi:phage tail protein [Granulicella arctica]|uniref:phage tail protein n=1 Tax=Granulicella arctica TaxID=940613 RepID=UPI0021DF8547|nr:tail fiber protein [Granulicella arctica]